MRWGASLRARIARKPRCFLNVWKTGLMQWQSKLKRRTRPVIVGGRDPSPMCLDDRAADRQSHAYAAGFGCEEAIEQLVRVLGGGPDTAVRHCNHHLISFVLMRSTHQLAHSIRDLLRRFAHVHLSRDDDL